MRLMPAFVCFDFYATDKAFIRVQGGEKGFDFGRGWIY